MSTSGFETMLPRETLLNEAKIVVTQDRADAYGSARTNFEMIASMLNDFGFRVHGERLKPHHVAVMMIQIKLARLTTSPDKYDTWLDIAGYASLGYECVC